MLRVFLHRHEEDPQENERLELMDVLAAVQASMENEHNQQADEGEQEEMSFSEPEEVPEVVPQPAPNLEEISPDESDDEPVSGEVEQQQPRDC